jgi:hypothetical protein
MRWSIREAPEDTRVPAMKLFGQKTMDGFRKQARDTTRLLDAFAEVLVNLYWTRMKVGEHLSNCERGILGTIARKSENPRILRIHTLTD